jgi:hypothetical protein
MSGRSSSGRPDGKEDLRSVSMSFVIAESGDGLRVAPPAFDSVTSSDIYGKDKNIAPAQLTVALSILGLCLFRNGLL